MLHTSLESSRSLFSGLSAWLSPWREWGFNPCYTWARVMLYYIAASQDIMYCRLPGPLNRRIFKRMEVQLFHHLLLFFLSLSLPSCLSLSFPLSLLLTCSLSFLLEGFLSTCLFLTFHCEKQMKYFDKKIQVVARIEPATFPWQLSSV